MKDYSSMSSEGTSSNFPEASGDGQTIHIVSGKGGVGKSTVAAVLAKKLASRGRRVLLVELSQESYLGPSLGLSGTGFKPTQISKNLDLALWDSESCLRDYILYLVKVERFYKLFFENKVMRSFIDVAPGLKELAILGKATSGIRDVGPDLNYEDIVIDSFSTGHTLALLKAPFAMKEVVSRGPMGQQARSICDVLQDPVKTKYYLVTIPEELPVTELMEFKDQLESVVSPSPKIILNKWIDSNVSEDELDSLKENNSGISNFAKYVSFKLGTQRKQRERLGDTQINAVFPLVFDASTYSSLLDKLAGETN